MPLIRRTQDAVAGGASGPPTGPADLETIQAGLRDSNADVRRRAAYALAAFPQEAGLLGEAATSEPDERVREAMFTSLSRIGGDLSVRALLPHLRSDDASRRTGAMDALKAMPDLLNAALVGLLQDPDSDVRGLACDLARELPSPDATALLKTVLDTDREVNVCAAAVDVIADIGTREALPHLERCAARFPDHPFLQFAVRIARDRIGDQVPFRG
jgi:HEAT repeat protein